MIPSTAAVRTKRGIGGRCEIRGERNERRESERRENSEVRGLRGERQQTIEGRTP